MSIDVVAQDGGTESGVTRSIWLMLELSNVLVSDTPPRQAYLVSCILSTVTKTTLGQDTSLTKLSAYAKTQDYLTFQTIELRIDRTARLHPRTGSSHRPAHSGGHSWGIRPEMCAS